MLPLAAVTVTVTVLFPACRPVRPATTAWASASEVVVTTATEVVPAATLTVLPVRTLEPAMLNTERSALLLNAATFTVTL